MSIVPQRCKFSFSPDSFESHAQKIILPYWERFSRDVATGGFYGRIDGYNVQDSTESRSIVMTARFLWAYSASARFFHNPAYLDLAEYAYKAICRDFIDMECGGVYWSVKLDGTADVTKKQIYGEAFAIYGLSEYAAAVQELLSDTDTARQAMMYAVSLYNLLEQFAYEPEFGGYIEARARNWSETVDLKLSPKDIDCCKSMNTNLHVMEAFTNLYRTAAVVIPEKTEFRRNVCVSLKALIQTTVCHIFNHETHHLMLYFDKEWNSMKQIVSYGHDIEASWLLQEAAEITGDNGVISEVRETVLNLAATSLDEGFDSVNGGLYNEIENDVRDETRIWWNQAEALTGFYNAWQMTGDISYYSAAEKTWDWICTKQVDYSGGEWYQAVRPDGSPVLTEDKGGNWKTAYHNVRACLELARRIPR